MKTVEEKRKEVMAYCERLCPNVGDFSRVRLLGIGKIERTSEVGFDPHYDGKIWAIFAHGGGKIMYFIHEDSDEAIIDFAYMLFGFAERDAVADEKARLLKRYRARIKRLRADDAETHRIQIEVKDERIAALQAKSAALVEALEEIKKVHGFAYTYGDGFSNVTDKRLNSTGVAIEKVIEAHKKGGVQG